MQNPLTDVPLNTKRVYVRATAKTGCKIYMPVDSLDDKRQITKRDELQIFLNNQTCGASPLVLA